MKDKTYNPNVNNINIPMTTDLTAWVNFFNELMQLDSFAPLILILNLYSFAHNLDINIPSTPYEQLYYDAAIEITADAEYPAEEAAIHSGFFEKGISMLVAAAETDNEFRDDCMTVVQCLKKDYDMLANILPASICDRIIRLHKTPKNHCDGCCCNDEDTCVIEEPEDWGAYFEHIMRTDSSAAASILTYYLKYAAHQEARVFCPLGCDLYDFVGRRMFESEDVLKAAIDVGIMVSAIATHFGAALDVPENWNISLEGTKFFLESDELKCFIPYADRRVAETLLAEFGEVIYGKTEDAWHERNRNLHKSLDTGTYRGY